MFYGYSLGEQVQIALSYLPGEHVRIVLTYGRHSFAEEARIVPGYLLDRRVQVAANYSLAEGFGELDLRSGQPLLCSTELGHPAAVLLREQ